MTRAFPTSRLTRLRRTDAMRDLVRETTVQAEDLIAPLFVVHGNGIRKPISSLPGQFHLSLDELNAEVQSFVDLGVKAVLLFGLSAEKDACGSEAYSSDGIVQQAVSQLKAAFSNLVVMTDVCLCGSTLSGHCGVLKDCGDQAWIDHDATRELLAKIAVSHAKAGADLVAPSSMTDGMIDAMRQGLDAAGFNDIAIMSYAVKYASSFYGPFREAVDSAPQKGDRKTYQMDPANSREAMAEAEQDLQEGADILMVKPGLPYLDIVAKLKANFDCPIAAYHVSGEYAMVKAAAEKGWIDEKAVLMESLVALKRAGADLIITYAIKDIF